jgi:hypothetical protein
MVKNINIQLEWVSKMKKCDQKTTEQNTEVVIGGVVLWVALNTHDLKTSYAQAVIAKIKKKIESNPAWKLSLIQTALNGGYYVIGRLMIPQAKTEVVYRFSSSGDCIYSPSERKDFIAVHVVNNDNSVMTTDEISAALNDLKSLLSS